MIQQQASIHASIEDDQIESIYVVFREDVTARETISFSGPEHHDTLIDVDEKDRPIAIQLVASCPFAKNLQIKDHVRAEKGPSEALSDLFAAANQMVAFHRANRQVLGNALIEDALKSARRYQLLANPTPCQ